MTVCIAAIAEEFAVIGASDRMLTAGDVQFEPELSKIRPLTSSIVVMIAGDADMQEEILRDVGFDISERLKTKPTEWIPVKDAAEFYRKRCNEAGLRRSQAKILEPLGMTHQSFAAMQGTMSAPLVTRLATELINFDPPETEAIIAGLDTFGPHVYVVHGTVAKCRDAVGFAAIGAGYWHANSQLMFGGHHRRKPVGETLLSVFTAKKRAEVAPGVGAATDMFYVGTIGAYTPVGVHILDTMADIHQRSVAEQQKAVEVAKGEMRTYVEALFALPAAPEQSALPEDSQRDEATDKEESGNGHAEPGGS